MRRIYTYVVNLPPDSAYSRAENSAPNGWDNTTEMVAELIDTTHGIIRILQAVHTQNPPTGDLPRVPRPYEKPAEPKTVSIAGLADFLGPH